MICRVRSKKEKIIWLCIKKISFTLLARSGGSRKLHVKNDRPGWKNLADRKTHLSSPRRRPCSYLPERPGFPPSGLQPKTAEISAQASGGARRGQMGTHLLGAGSRRDLRQTAGAALEIRSRILCLMELPEQLPSKQRLAFSPGKPLRGFIWRFRPHDRPGDRHGRLSPPVILISAT